MIARTSAGSFASQTEYYRQRVDAQLAEILRREPDAPERLVAAMEYSVLGPGKRIRPLLVYASGRLCALEDTALDAIACAVELIHAYSLIHDDLPAMDDDDLRRGRPTTHRAFDEALAILAGDALQALAFESLCTDPTLSRSPVAQIRIIARLTRAVGPAGMVGGQVLDMQAEGRSIDATELENIHRRKTGALIHAAITMPSELSALDDHERARLDSFAADIGLVFQIRDDLLEIEQDTATLGKHAGSDRDNQKSTYPSILGPAAARAAVDRMHRSALDALAELGPRADALRWVSDYVLTRSH